MNANLLWIQELGGTLAGTVVGALIAWLIAHVYARKSARDLMRQRDRLERYNQVLTTLFRTWEEQGLIELTRDPKGEVIGGRVIRAHDTAPAVSGGKPGPSPGT